MFGSLLAIGITSLIAIQVVINIAVVTSSMPATGMPLPFFSYRWNIFILLIVWDGNTAKHFSFKCKMMFLMFFGTGSKNIILKKIKLEKFLIEKLSIEKSFSWKTFQLKKFSVCFFQKSYINYILILIKMMFFDRVPKNIRIGEDVWGLLLRQQEQEVILILV